MCAERVPALPPPDSHKDRHKYWEWVEAHLREMEREVERGREILRDMQRRGENCEQPFSKS